jgi:hypothetical protein
LTNFTNIDIRIPDCFLDVAVIIGGPVVEINIYFTLSIFKIDIICTTVTEERITAKNSGM